MDSLALAPQVYSRKDKSLGVLVANFLTLYNRPDVDLFGLDDAAAKLGEFYLSCLPINFVFDWVLDKLYYALSN
jgi:hypothetical protein